MFLSGLLRDHKARSNVASLPKWIAVSIILVFSITLMSCKGDDGAVSIRFTHDTGLEGFVYDDTNLPSQISSFTSYATKPGSYNADWKYQDQSTVWSASYTIKADEGGYFWSDGDDREFALYMGRGTYDFGTLSLDEEQPKPVEAKHVAPGDGLDFEGLSRTFVTSYTKRSGGFVMEVSIFKHEPEEAE